MNPEPTEPASIRHIRRLIWLYFWFLIFEGALRKWVFPQLSNPLLIVRDPVLLLIYAFAIYAGVFPKNWWVTALWIIGLLSFAISYVPLWDYLGPMRITLVAAYGFRSDFLHLPLIFLMPRVLRSADVKRFGWWTLAVVIPMAVLMVAQFHAAPDAFLNRNAGGEGEMMTSALGKVRTPATFSFVVGVASYFALATGFIVWGALRRDVFKTWLLIGAGSAVVIGVAVSGSRTVVGACAVVTSSLLVILFLRPSAMNRFGQTLIVTLIAGLIVTRTPIFKEGFNVLSTRFNEVAEVTEKSVGAGLVERVLSDFEEGIFVLTKAPFLGYGLGIGTNAGAKFLTGHNMFLLAEGEWQRVFLESGPVLGLAYVLCRCGMVIAIGLLCLRSVRAGNLLPILLFSASFLSLINGQFGQPTVLGFTVFITGLALSARNSEVEEDEDVLLDEAANVAPARRVLVGRSVYASRLHGPATAPEHSNGSVDR